MKKIICAFLLFTTFYSYSQVSNYEGDTITIELRKDLERIYLMGQGI